MQPLVAVALDDEVAPCLPGRARGEFAQIRLLVVEHPLGFKFGNREKKLISVQTWPQRMTDWLIDLGFATKV